VALSVWRQANVEWRMLEYRALGGLCVVDDGDEVNLGGPRQRRLAAALLVDRNQVVSIDRLEEVVFAGEPTPGAATTLRSYVARLRRVVEGAAGSGCRVVTRQPGYMLEVGDAAFDVARFEASVATGRACLTRADPAEASRALRKGLGLWRGTAYAEFADEDWVRPEARRLGELRLVAYDLLADAELACGRAAEAASDLEVLAAEHPLRESFQAKLMLALYRSGRHVEALRAYQAHREVLAGELGLEPAPELAELEGRILVHDEALRELEPGELRLRGYRLGERLGSGRDGTVYAARLPGVDRDIAIRVVPEALANDPGFVRSFDADARRVAALRHPAVVPLYDWWREAGAAYVVMRRMRGGRLRDRLQRGSMPAGEVATLAGRVGAALVAAVEAGIAHGRVVAESVLFDEAGNAHLADFPLGTVRAGAVGDDVRELAAVVAEALSGRRPAGATVEGLPPPVAEVVTAALSAPEPPALADFVPAVVAALSGEVAGPVYARPNPYKGLRAFDEPDAEDFFGRDALVDEVLGRLAGHGVDGRLVLVVGGSGSGKSSLVRAGLLPRVRRGGAGGSDRWFVASMVPGASPFKELAESLRQVAVIEAPGVAQELAGEEGIDRVVRRIVPEGGELLLVVDQLEELFTLADEGEQRAFLGGLAHALGVADGRLRVVATLRADFYDRPLRFEGFGAAVGVATVPIAAMSAAELEAAVVRPLERVGGHVEPALVAELVGAVLHEPAALPSLQFTLYELAERSPDRDLTLAAYRELGGVDAAIAARAEALYRSLDDAARGGVRRLFERLVVVGTEGEPTRRRVLRAELTDAGGPATDEVLEVIEAWAQARLLTLDHHLESRQPTVEVSHEAVLRDWPRLRGWLEEDREEIVALGQLREAAASWDGLDRDPGALYRGARLDTALDVAERGARTLPPLEREFLDASRTERDRERQREADQLRRTARANRRLRAQLVALAVALVVALIVGTVAVGQRNRASEQRRVATARELAAAANANLDVDPERSILLAVEAVDVARRADGVVLREAEEALHRAVKSSRIIRTVPQGGFGLAVSSDGARFVTGGLDPGDATATVWDTDTGEELMELQGEARVVALSPDDRLVAIAHGDGTLRLWDAATGDVLHVLRGHEGFVTQPAFSPDGRWLAAGGADETVRVWDVAAGREEMTLTGHTSVVISTAFSPDGSRLATASDDTTARIWDLATGEVAATLSGHVWAVTSVSFSPDGQRVATASIDGEARIWDAETGTLLRRFAGPAPLQAVAFSPDGTRLATAGSDAVARVWDVETGREMVRLAGHSGMIGNLAFTPDGDRLLTTGLDGTTRLWDVSVAGARDWLTVPSARLIYAGVDFAPDGATFAAPAEPNGVTIWDAQTGDEVITLAGHEPKLTTVDFSPDGTKLVAASDRTERPPVWDVRSGELLFTLDGHTNTVRVAAFSPDGRRIVTGSLDTTARVWDAGTGEQVGVLRSDEGAVDAVAYSPDGRLLVTGDEGGDVRVWDATTLEPVRTLRGHTNAILDVAFGPGGMLATTSDDGTARVWDVASGKERVTFRGHRGPVNQVAISPHGRRVATTGEDATTKLWDPASGRELLTLVGHDNLVYGVDFSPDGRLLATASTDGTTALHLLPIDEFRDLARERVTRGLTDQECRDYLHLAACS
jgi:WD40 repeat protein/DNA-binding SARP family transcriptional activator